MDIATPTLAALLVAPLHLTVCDPSPCRKVTVMAEGNRVVIDGPVSENELLSVMLRSFLAANARIKAQVDAMKDTGK